MVVDVVDEDQSSVGDGFNGDKFEIMSSKKSRKKTFRTLRLAEREKLKEKLTEFSSCVTKIEKEEIDFKKSVVPIVVISSAVYRLSHCRVRR